MYVYNSVCVCVQELMALRAEQAELKAARQKQDETLRQRERELTALKGALKDD